MGTGRRPAAEGIPAVGGSDENCELVVTQADESRRHAGRNDALEYVAKHVTFTKSMQPIL
jgi:hypothetical protein